MAKFTSVASLFWILFCVICNRIKIINFFNVSQHTNFVFLTSQHIDHIMGLHGKQVMQAIVLILEGDHNAEVKEQALCILANIADGDFAKNFIMSNEDVLKKLTTYMVNEKAKCNPLFNMLIWK